MGVADKLARHGGNNNVRRILEARYCRRYKSSSLVVVLSHPNNSQERNADNSRFVSPCGSLWARRTLRTEMMMGEIKKGAMERFGSGRRWSSNIRGDFIVGGEADVAILGAGILGLATAREIVLRFPHTKVVVVEKEPDIAAHQISHNR
ncbi:unnamed protein product [Sphagnum jensenii]|uniref:L-2-hydroxyglutarate dehydrogenase, mitochondrial n=1 Tax=Sphagnum jensenii TaxID=128206 RepID=A0ABP1AWC7_9BRYO